MKARCSNPNNHKYKDYGGRGIKVCDEWLHSFTKFYEWAMAKFAEGLGVPVADSYIAASAAKLQLREDA